jgi:hypothetical protein
MIKNGFIKENTSIEYEEDKIYKIPFYNKGQHFVNITSSSNITIVDGFKFKYSNLKQHVSFKITGDITQPLYLNYNSEGKYTKIYINIKETNTFSLNKSFIKEGQNIYVIKKNSQFKSPKVILQTNKGSRTVKTDVFYDEVKFKINASEKGIHKIRIKDGLKTKQFVLNWGGKQKSEDVIDYDIKYSYASGKIKMILTSKNRTPKSDFVLSVSGDLNDDFVWKKGNKTKEIIFAHQILKTKILNFNINGMSYTTNIINKSYFPSKIAKTKNGIRFEKPTPEEMILKIDDVTYTVPPKVMNYDINWEGKKMFKLYYKNILLVRQKLTKEKYLPELYVVNNPLKIKLSHRYYEDVKVTFADSESKYVIPAGQTEVLIQHKNVGMRHLSITYVENAIPKMNTWKVFVQ